MHSVLSVRAISACYRCKPVSVDRVELKLAIAEALAETLASKVIAHTLDG